MSGRGDHNKNRNSGQGSSNQSNQAVGRDVPKSNHGEPTGGQASKPQPKQRDTSSDRNRGVPDDAPNQS